MPTPRLTESDIGCWVVKSALAPTAVVPGWQPGSVAEVVRCVRRSYRLSLMQRGQRLVLWCSGPRGGVHAVGTLTTPPAPDDDPDGPRIGVRLLRLAAPVPRSDLLGHPAFAATEVLRVPAGSNPSFLRPDETAALIDLLDAADLRAAGWLPGARAPRATVRVEPPARWDRGT